MTYSQAALDRAKLLRANEKMPGATQSALDFALDNFQSQYLMVEGKKMWRETIHILSEKNQEATP